MIQTSVSLAYERLVVAGSAEFKTVLIEAERFDQRLKAKVLTLECE